MSNLDDEADEDAAGADAWFDWDDGDRYKIDDHRVAVEEAEEALLDPDGIRTDVYNSGRERRRGFIGATVADRVLFIAYTMRAGRVRVVTARDATEAERRRYSSGR